MTEHTPATCTVQNAITGACGEPAVWSNGTFAECVTHAADPGSLARTSSTASALDGVGAGDLVSLRVYGTGPRVGRVVSVGRTNARVRVTLADGREKVVTHPVADLTPYAL